MQKPKKDRVFYITHSGELLFWLVVILFVVGFMGIFSFHKVKSENDYRLYLPDVDGLIVGSPVRMMGIEIGYVTKIKPVHDEVFVSFIIRDKNIKLPQGTVATVEFTGMAGSKSLELYPPDENTYIDSTIPILASMPPKRLHDAIGLLNDMFKRMGAMITTVSIFSKNIKSIDIPQSGNAGDFKSFLNFTNIAIDNATKRANDFEARLMKYEK